jgi:hypothetical protein
MLCVTVHDTDLHGGTTAAERVCTLSSLFQGKRTLKCEKQPTKGMVAAVFAEGKARTSINGDHQGLSMKRRQPVHDTRPVAAQFWSLVAG